ncbi:hypothetical protein BGZ72_000585 [Mortierella alpina]|nr:hypothetical protein BGZ72_000585 [Mortierella alpina]
MRLTVLAASVLSPLLFLTVAVDPVYGQDSVVSVTGPAFARYGTKLYISGGGYTVKTNYINSTSQFFYLDLAVEWEATSPAWRRLRSGPSNTNSPGAISGDGKTMVTFLGGDQSFAWLYNVEGDSWSHSKIIVPTKLDGLYGVTDPTTGLVYVPGGYDNTKNNTLASMLIYHFSTDTTTVTPMPPSGLVNRWHYKAAWWPRGKSILYFGGYNYPSTVLASTEIIQYTPSTNTWSTLSTTNQGPSGRADFCMDISEDGSKLVIFGGRAFMGPNWKLTNELYILDLDTLTWSKGQSYSATRTYSACTIVGSTFISWGGQDEQTTAPLAPVLYDINKNQYITSFMPIATHIREAETNATDKPSQNLGAILGGVLGSLSIIALSVGIFIYKRRQDSRCDADGGPDNDGVYRKVAMDPYEHGRSHDATSLVSRHFDKQAPSATSLTLTSTPSVSGPQLYAPMPGIARSPHGDPAHSLGADGHGKGAEEVRGPQAVLSE